MGSSSGSYDEEDAYIDAMLFSTSNVLPMVLHAAVELDLFGIIAEEGPGAYVSAAKIASRLPTPNPEAPALLNRMLRLFVGHSLLSYSVQTVDGRVERVYGLTPACKFFIRSKDEGSVCSFLALAHHRATTEVWLNMKDVILEGGSLFERVHGMSIFEFMKKDPEFSTIFNEAMTGVSTMTMNAILEVYQGFEGLGSLVDVGGGTGKTLNMNISRYPSIKGVNYDLPHVLRSAHQYTGEGYNTLVEVPSGEAIMIKDTCHNWSDKNVVKILKNIYEELPEVGKLIIMNAIMAEQPESTKTSQYVSRRDNTMLTQPAGKERTAQEYKNLTEAAGFLTSVLFVWLVAYAPSWNPTSKTAVRLH